MITNKTITTSNNIGCVSNHITPTIRSTKPTNLAIASIPEKSPSKAAQKDKITNKIILLNILAARNRKFGNLEIRVPVLGNRLFCA